MTTSEESLREVKRRNPNEMIDLSNGEHVELLQREHNEFEVFNRVPTVIDDEISLLQRVGLDYGMSMRNLGDVQEKFRKYFHTSQRTPRLVKERGGDNAVMGELVDDIRDVIHREFPEENYKPKPSQTIPRLGTLSPNKPLFKPDDFVEIKGWDQRWRLVMVTRVIKNAPNDYDWNLPSNKFIEPEWNFTFNAGAHRDVDSSRLRASKTALKIVFGSRPFVWQQWALLKLEAKLRFQDSHQDDFLEMDIEKFGMDSFKWWLNQPRNEDFRRVYYDERVGEKGRALLLDHIQKPFQVLNSIAVGEDEWNFADDPYINVFTYLSMFGTGLLLPVIVLTVQVAIPVILLYMAEEQEDCGASGDPIPKEERLAKLMALAVFIYYMFSVIPNAYVNFFNISGGSNSVYSRLLSIRRILWYQADDSLLQMIGYKLDLYLNTSYETALSMLNIYIILLEKSTIEVILNALAFAFIAKIDEELIQSGWYDPTRRWCKSGAMNIVIQANLNLSALKSSHLFAKKYNIPEAALQEACDGDRNFLKNRKISKRDRKNGHFMTHTEQLEDMCATIAEEEGNRNALGEYKKQKQYFGVLERVLSYCFEINPIFHRYKDFYTWSIWNRILFLSPVPKLDEIFNTDLEGNVTSVNKGMDRQNIEIENFRKDRDEKNSWVLFSRHYFNVISFREMYFSVKPTFKVGFGPLLFRVLDGFITWASYFIHLAFPIYLFFAIGEVVYNIVTNECFHPIVNIRNHWFGMSK